MKSYLINDSKCHPFAVICPGGGYSSVCSFVEGKISAEDWLKYAVEFWKGQSEK